MEDETQEIPSDNHPADTATITVDREIDYTLEENSEQVLAEIDAALQRIEAGTYGICADLREADRRGAPRGGPVHDAVHRLQAQGGARVSEPASRTLDVRVGSSTDALTPVSVAERSLRRGRGPVGRARRRSSLAAIAADQLTKLIVTSQLALDERSSRRAVLDPPRPELGDRVRPLRQRDVDRHGADRARGRAGCWSSSPAPARAIRCCPVALGLLIGGLDVEPDRPDPPRARDGLPRPPLLAGVQPRRLLHRRRGRRSCSLDASSRPNRRPRTGAPDGSDARRP